MKRKRASIKENVRSRPFQSRVELLNECLSLTLRYNIEFGYEQMDLTLYRHAENLKSCDELALFVKRISTSIANRQELTGI